MTEHRTPTAPAHAPDLPSLSAYLDGELDAGAREHMATHLAACPLCAARLGELQALSAGLKSLPHEALGFDLASVIEARLGAAAPRSRGTRRGDGAWPWWPVALGAALSITAGMFMGSALVGDAISTPPLAAMRVFDSMPPGSLCIGFESCYIKGNPP
jgi:anti-sigma factor RsiW